jgi:hypothetical protein
MMNGRACEPGHFYISIADNKDGYGRKLDRAGSVSHE